MGGSADTAGMPDIGNRQAFFRCEIASQDQPLETELESGPDFSHSEMRAARGPLFCLRFGSIFLVTFLSTSSVAAFRGSSPASTNGARFAASWHARKIIAPEAPRSHTAFLNIRPDSSSEGDRCMKDTNHPIRHPLRHPRIFGRVRRRTSCTRYGGQFGHGQNTGLGWSDPHFCARFRAQSNSWGRSSPTARQPRRVFCPRNISQQGATVMNNGDENHTELSTVHEIAELLAMPVSWVCGHSFQRE